MERVSVRLKRELVKFLTDPPEGVSCCLKDGCTNILEATITGPKGTPYEGGLFYLEINIPVKYPFIHPTVKFVSPIYHPNVDDGGRICLNILRMPPSGSWTCTMTLECVLIAVQALMSSPNPDDPLMPEIATEYLTNREEFIKKARDMTQQLCIQMPRVCDAANEASSSDKRKSEFSVQSADKKMKMNEGSETSAEVVPSGSSDDVDISEVDLSSVDLNSPD